MTDEKTYQLSNLEIDSVGLVTRGAVTLGDKDDETRKGKNFIVFKSDNEGKQLMADEKINIEEVTEDNPGVLDRLITKWFSERIKAGEEAVAAEQSPEPVATETEPEAPKPETVQDEVEVVGEQEEDETPTEESEEPTMTKSDNTAIQALMDAQFEKLEKMNEKQRALDIAAIEKQHREQIAKLEATVTILAGDAEKATEAKERQEMLQKAEGVRSLGMPATDLANLLYVAKQKFPAEQFEAFDTLLKSADNKVTAAGIFGEIGTSRTPTQITLEDKIEKAAKETNPADALLDLSAADQMALAKEWDDKE